MAIGGFTVAARAVQTFAVACFLAISANASPLDPAPQNNPSVATAGETTYLSLTRSEMRSQMAAGKLDAAARTLQWIRKIDPDDDVAGVLAIELQLRRGNVAAAAMRLIEILDQPDSTVPTRAEADRILDLLESHDDRDSVLVSRAMLDAASLNAAPAQLLVAAVDGNFGYMIPATLPAAPDMSASILAFAPTTPGAILRAAPAPAPAQAQLAAAVPPVPSGPPPLQGGSLIDMVFEDPTNLQLNFALFQQQLSNADLDGAMVTLERVLLIDPESKLAKVLLADVNMKKGNLPLARKILSDLLAEDDTPLDMATRAEFLLGDIESRLDPVRVRSKLALEFGQTENAFGRSKSDEILFLNLPISNATPDKSDPYVNYRASVTAIRELNRQTPTLLETGVSVTGRDTRHRDLSDIRTVSANLSVTELARVGLSGGLFASSSRVNHKSFSSNAGLFVAVTSTLAEGWKTTQSLSASRTYYRSYPGIADNPGRTDRSYAAKLDLNREFERAVMSLALSAGRAKARNRIHSLKFHKAEMALAGVVGDLNLIGSVSRQWTRKDAADTLISPLRPKLRQDVRSLKLRYPPQSGFGGLSLSPYLRVTSHSTKSNIANHRREGSEAAIGIETAF